jgi:hypothetical protein
MRRNALATCAHLFFAALGGRLGAPMMVLGYLVVAGVLLLYVSAQVYTHTLMEDVAARTRREVVARERVGMLTARYATMTSKSRISRACEERLGLEESTTSDVVRVVIDGAPRPDGAHGAAARARDASDSGLGDLSRVMRR